MLVVFDLFVALIKVLIDMIKHTNGNILVEIVYRAILKVFF